MLEQLKSLLENQFLSGGLVLMALGTVLMLLKSYAFKGLTWLSRRFIADMEVRNDTMLFNWFCDWLDELPYAKRSRRLTLVGVNAPIEGSEAPVTIVKGNPNKTSGPRVIFTPAPGHHFFIYRGRPIWLARVREDKAAGGGGGDLLSALRERESLHFRMVGRSQDYARQVVLDVMKLAVKSTQAEPRLMVSTYGYWRQRGYVRDRSVDSVVLPGGVVDGVVRDATEFLASRQWYLDRNVPYRRGYLLAGITGSGKTTLVSAIAATLRMELYVLNLNGETMCDDRLVELIAQVSERSIILLEDVDAVTQSRVNKASKRKTESREDHVSLSAVLNVIDGLIAPEGCLTFMTTNYPERLDDALIRPGRMDYRVDFDYATHDQVNRMFARFFDREKATLDLNGKRVTMAEVQEVLVRHRKDPDAAATTLAANEPAPLP